MLASVYKVIAIASLAALGPMSSVALLDNHADRPEATQRVGASDPLPVVVQHCVWDADRSAAPTQGNASAQGTPLAAARTS